MAFIHLEKLGKEYRSGDVVTPVLHEIDLAISEGEFVAIVGPSGSGKSTLMHILGFLDRPSSGSYTYEDRDSQSYSDDELAALRNKDIGFVFQSFNLLPKTSVMQNVLLPMTYSRLGDPVKRAQQSIDAVGLTHRSEYLSNQLSGGEKQRVAIARALVADPKLLFADEPTGNLDSKSGQGVMAILQELNKEGKTIIMVTHESDVAAHATRIVHIKDGKIETDTPVKKRKFADKDMLVK